MPTADFISILGGKKTIDGQPGNTFDAYLEKRRGVLEQVNRVYEYTLYQEMTSVMLMGDKIKAAYIGWNTTYALLNTVDEANAIFDQWQAHMDKYAGQTKGYQTTELYVFRATQNEMLRSALMGVLLSLVVSLLVMLATTLNWWTSLIGIFNIFTILGVFLGTLPILGWELGEYESIFMIATVGLSVDYTVHLLHAFNHAHGEDGRPAEALTKKEKAKSALGEMGISVVSSAITTLLSASILFACNFYFFYQFGSFIFLVIGLSILAALTALMPLVMLIGPDGDRGKITFIDNLFHGKAAK
jgi:predicted RND superfamily exporter protein